MGWKISFWIFILLSEDSEGCRKAESTAALFARQTLLAVPTSNYHETNASPPPYGSCGHSRYWNVRSLAQGASIVGGREALPAEFPWNVAITTDFDRPFCGGSILNENYVLTAGLDGLASIEKNVSALTMHPSYQMNDQLFTINDLAIIKLSSPLNFSQNWSIQPICLPTSCSDSCQPGDSVLISGWGLSANSSRNEWLRASYLKVITPFQCATHYKASAVLKSAMCAGTQSSGVCPGDSGGPVACFRNGYFVLAGVISGNGYCLHAIKSPSVFTRLCSYVEWINSIINE